MLLEIKSLSKKFYQGKNNEVEVLKNLELCVDSGQTVAIIGPSGSGKSTLLSLLAGIDRPQEGDIIFNKKSFKNATEDELSFLRSQTLGIIFQQFHLLPHLSALENVSLVLEISRNPRASELAKKALKDVGLDHRMTHLPSELSGGEKQRVAIARSLVITPKLLLADEPSGSLDEKTGEEVMSLLFSLVEKEKTALILVTHNRKLAERCSKVFHLDGGHLSELK